MTTFLTGEHATPKKAEKGNKMQNNKQKWAHMLSNTIKKRDLYGRSFTAGVALYTLASEGWLDDEMAEELEALLHAYLGEDLVELMSERGLRTWARDLVHLVDLAVLDDIARELEGENDEE